MRKFNKTQRNYMIIGICAILVIMTAGYAVFQSQLKISGTSNITSNWDVKITDIQSKEIVGGAGNSSDPTHTDTTATFKASFQSPGDSISYDVTVSNDGSIDAKLDKITLSDSNNPAIKFETNGIKEGDLLAQGTTSVLTVKVSYDNAVTGQPNNLNATLTVTLDYSQAPEGYTPPATTQTVYRRTAESLYIGDSIEGIKVTTDPSTLVVYGRRFYLKHEVEDNKITASYVCFETDAEYCIQGGSAEYYNANKSILQSQEEWFNNNGTGCSFYDNSVSCNYSRFVNVDANANGSVAFNESTVDHCFILQDGQSKC